MINLVLGFWLVVYGINKMVVLPPDGQEYTYETKELCEKAAVGLDDAGLEHVCIPNNYEVKRD